MAFSDYYANIPVEALVRQSLDTSERTLAAILQKGRAETLGEFAALLSPRAGIQIEGLAQCSQYIAQKHYGKTIRLFAPLYLSNECINTCQYCGFSRNNPIPRVTLPVETVFQETQLLAQQGFRSLLLVSGEHPKYVANGYVEECVRECLKVMPSINLELAPMETEPYIPLVKAGSEMLVVYQETYHQPTYQKMHIAGPKKNYKWRMDTMERGYKADFLRLGIGVLLGLYDWRYEAISLAAHAQYLLKHCWRSQISISLPRLRPAAGAFQPEQQYGVSDRAFVQLICALRMFLPHISVVLSTREAPELRNALVPLGITHMSAGASTEPGGYSSYNTETWKQTKNQPGEQFHIADERPPIEVANMIRSLGYEPVWKDFDQSLATEESETKK